MPESAAQSWLSEHDGHIPALDVYHQQALEALEHEASTLAQLADIIALDPGMSISLYRQVNSRQKKDGRPALGTIHNALSLLGDKAVTDFVVQHKTLCHAHSDTEVQQAYHQLMSQGYHLLSQLNLYTSIHGVASLSEIQSAGLLYNIGEQYALLFDFERYRRYLERTRESGQGRQSAIPEFGFEFQSLSRLLASQWYLPELLSDALSYNAKTGRKARLIQLAADISAQAEAGWSNPALQVAIEASAKFISRSQREIETKTRTAAIESARNFPLADVFPAAARLILLPDVKKPAPVVRPLKVVTDKTGAIKINDTIRALIITPGVTATRIIGSAIKGLYHELEFSRVILIVPSQDGHLTLRMSKGLDPDSPFQSLKIEAAQIGLFKALMTKPQSLWVNSANFRKYDAMLPGSFKAASLSQNFFLMSLFVGKKPVGFIYCDRSNTENNLDQSLYSEFKSCLMLTNKALTFIARRNKEKAA